jgi:hypothetical protein
MAEAFRQGNLGLMEHSRTTTVHGEPPAPPKK